MMKCAMSYSAVTVTKKSSVDLSVAHATKGSVFNAGLSLHPKNNVQLVTTCPLIPFLTSTTSVIFVDYPLF